MSLARHDKFKIILSAAILLGMVVLGYQNCSQVSDQKKLASGSDLASTAPFAFDVDVDTYAYMSCSERPELDKNTHFTVKMGALRPGSGVYLSSSFINFINENRLSNSKIQQVLYDNVYSRDAKLQVSLRATNNLRGNPLGTGPFPERITTVWSSLTAPSFIANIANSDPVNKINFNNGSYLMGSFLISGSSELTIQDAISNTGIGVVGFQGAFFPEISQRDFRIIAPFDVYGNNVNGVFGRGYDPTFDFPIYNGSKVPMHGARVLGSLTERQIMDGSMGALASWYCKSQAQYRIVPVTEVANAGCNMNATNTGLTGDDAKAYGAAKAFFIDSMPGGRWRIDQANRCLIDMYSSTTASQCYDMNKGTIQWGIGASDTCGGISGKQCPQYASFCWR